MIKHDNIIKGDKEPTTLTTEVLEVIGKSSWCIFMVINLEISVKGIRVIDMQL